MTYLGHPSNISASVTQKARMEVLILELKHYIFAPSITDFWDGIDQLLFLFPICGEEDSRPFYSIPFLSPDWLYARPALL